MLIMTPYVPSDFKLYCVFTKGNFTLEVDIGMNYTGVVGDQLLKCLDCRMDGMGCYLVPLRYILITDHHPLSHKHI